MTEYANGPAMMFGKSRIKEAEQLYARAASARRPTPWSWSWTAEAARAEVAVERLRRCPPWWVAARRPYFRLKGLLSLRLA